MLRFLRGTVVVMGVAVLVVSCTPVVERSDPGEDDGSAASQEPRTEDGEILEVDGPDESPAGTVSPMNRDELIGKIVSEVNITRADADRALESIIDGITQSLKQGRRVNISGFGTFSVSKRKARLARNPQTGESINIPARRVARFTAGKELKEDLER